MSRLRSIATLAAAALLAAGCGDQLASTTQHFFYGYVVSVDEHALCLSDARTEDLEAERCFEIGEADVSGVAQRDLVKVRYERGDEGGHGSGTAVTVQMVRSGRQSGD